MGECKDYRVTVTIGMDYEVKVKSSDFESASKMGEEYVKRHFLEMEPLDKPFIRKVRTEEAD